MCVVSGVFGVSNKLSYQNNIKRAVLRVTAQTHFDGIDDVHYWGHVRRELASDIFRDGIPEAEIKVETVCTPFGTVSYSMEACVFSVAELKSLLDAAYESGRKSVRVA